MFKTIKKLINNKLFRLVSISSLIFISLIIIISIILINNSKSNINIDTTGTKISVPASEMKRVYNKLSGTIKNNLDDFDENKEYKGTIDQYEEKLGEKKNTATFLVNFDEIKQSYRVNVMWPNAQNMSDISITCPIQDSKYPDTPCKTEANSTSDISSYLPYYGTLDSGQNYTALYRYTGDKPFIEVDIDSCGDVSLINLALTKFKAFLSEKHFNPKDFNIFAPNSLCDGGAESSSKTKSTSETFYYTGNPLSTKDQNINNALPFFVPSRYFVYPNTDEQGNITSIHADISGCTAYQATPMEERVKSYLNSHNINYTVEFSYCKNP